MQTSPAGRSESPQNGPSKTEALKVLVENARSRLGLKKAINRSAVEEAARSDFRGIYLRRNPDQIKKLVEAILSSALGEKSRKRVNLEDVEAIRQKLNTLSGRVRILSDPATKGIAALLARNGGVRLEEVVTQVEAGLDVGLPDPKNKMMIRDKILNRAEGGGYVGTRQYLQAAEKALRYEIQKRLVSDAIMEQFQGLGSEEEVVPVVLERLHVRRRDEGKTQGGKPRSAGKMSGNAIRDLEQALNDRKFQSDVQGAVRPGRNVRAVTGAGVVPQPNEGVLAELRNEFNRRA